MKALKTKPKEITFDDDNLTIKWKDKTTSVYNLLQLRKVCPCATCRGGDFGEIGTMTRDIKKASIKSFSYSGNYAIQILWNDYHDTGFYTYKYLREIEKN